ncbi:transglycosylase SLT domain-containing protein [Arenimonas caeni]|uniref:transglycosylase SLT domain-containing protein n=1 Tax=Arenimonas caeni TaxID=2058085 RepID=UPI002A35D89B|nr:transglycosylase SLT domain-containing protein [Arenimonas caeni]MDY0021402.1 transglycosylase SLT domain-containing protein [Arenimonas caeni]
MSRMLPLAVLLLALAAPTVAAQSPQPLPRPADLGGERPAILEAFRLAEGGQLSLTDLARVKDHPLLPWVEVVQLRRQMASVPAGDIRAALRRYEGEPAGEWLRSAWLQHLATHQRWPDLLADWRPADSLELRCAHLAARLATGATDPQWIADGKALWLRGESLPASCDTPFASLQALGQIDASMRWQRIELTLLGGQTGLARFLARDLPGAEAKLANDYADFIDSPHARAAGWPKDARSRAVVAEGLARLARRSPDAAEAQLATLDAALDLGETARGKVLYEVALWTVASYLPGARERLAKVPRAAYDERLYEWRVREAMARGDDAGALAAIEFMPAPQRDDPRWQYFEARLRERLGQSEAARGLYGRAAGTATFHGFMAADRLGSPYTLCPIEPSTDPVLRARVATHPGVVRALELFTIGRSTLATREWSALLRVLTPDERKVAIEFARDAHWYDRAVFTIGDSPEDLRHYSLRFPLHHEAVLRREARLRDLDPAWVAAQTRAESAFMPLARSHANARGLMQLLPSTAERTARKIRVPWTGADSLYRPELNLQLGIAHLRHELDQHGGIAYQAIAAYNAGPAPVMRWNRDRPGFDPDFWIETATYKETREYVARVLAFSVIYDWRLEGSAVPVSQRLLGRTVPASARRPFTCPTPSGPGTPP